MQNRFTLNQMRHVNLRFIYLLYLRTYYIINAITFHNLHNDLR